MNKVIKHQLSGLFFLWATYQLSEAFIYFYNDLFAFLSIMGTVLVLAHVIAKLQGLRGISAYLLSWNTEAKYLLITGMLSGLITYLLSFTMSLLAGRELITAHVTLDMSLIGQIFLCIIGTLLPSIAEDIITRGYPLATFARGWNKALFVLISALFYVLNHTYKLAALNESLLYLFITGIALVIPLVLTKSLWYSFGLHWACNIIYRITNDVFKSTSVGDYSISSFRILMIFVVLSIPFNIYILKRLNYGI